MTEIVGCCSACACDRFMFCKNSSGCARCDRREGGRKESRRKTEEPERSVKELDVRRIRRVGVFAFPSPAPEYARGKGGHTAMIMGMCRDPWKDMRAASLWFIYTPVTTVTRVPVVSWGCNRYRGRK